MLTLKGWAGRTGLNCGMGAGFIGWGAWARWGAWLGAGVRVENPGRGGNGSMRPSIGVNGSETEGVGEVMCANVSGKEGVW